ncbi:M48 family metallopeptidase [Limoniibacter endophyticus]|uniref:YgjP-like metallopeptidase domain-containing protein n=1 Tax=Limoniibacter endophyticus TaxID=1565040 RepID=A0A8J3GFH0_9HYPH|nr:M48 family metallopeptidase [Limoniibacter endophyticus]GHC66935.1 hypothetical protein GCM10010136_10530 [Limoniibacter endophyticus]
MGFGLFRRKRTVETRATSHVVAGKVVPLRVVENERAKRLTLRIETGGKGLRVTIPKGLRNTDIEGFLDRHENWIVTKLSALPENPVVRHGIRIPVRGKSHLIVHVPGTRGTASLSEDERGPLLLVYGAAEHLPRRIADFLKKQAREDIGRLVAKHAATVGRKPKAIRFKDTTSRWGSCTSDGTLSFSWRIMMAPAPVIDYLVAHEVAHLIEMNHGPNFWTLCEKLCPETRRCKDWLKRNGTALHAIRFN